MRDSDPRTRSRRREVTILNQSARCVCGRAPQSLFSNIWMKNKRSLSFRSSSLPSVFHFYIFLLCLICFTGHLLYIKRRKVLFLLWKGASSSAPSWTLNGFAVEFHAKHRTETTSRTWGHACVRHFARTAPRQRVFDASVRTLFRLIRRLCASCGPCGADTRSLSAHTVVHTRESSPNATCRHLELFILFLF